MGSSARSSHHPGAPRPRKVPLGAHAARCNSGNDEIPARGRAGESDRAGARLPAFEPAFQPLQNGETGGADPPLPPIQVVEAELLAAAGGAEHLSAGPTVVPPLIQDTSPQLIVKQAGIKRTSQTIQGCQK